MTIIQHMSTSWLVSEANAWRSRNEVVVTVPEGGLKSGQLLKAGTDALEATAAAGDTAVAILLVDTGVEAGTAMATVVARDAEVFGPALIGFEGATDEQQKTLANTLGDGIAVRWK